MYHFCTYFDQHYLPRGLALYRSLKEHCSDFQLWVLCLDGATYDVLSSLHLPCARLIALGDLEAGDEELLGAKYNRSRVEYYFTCTPSLPLSILHDQPEVKCITYLDADLFFFADPAPIFDEVADHSVAIVAHRFPPNLRHLETHGIYNVGWLSFRRDQHALACLRWWRDQCIEWCYDRVDNGRFADQEYLDDWPTRFRDVIVLQHKGANLAPWNLANYSVGTHENQIWVDEQPLVFFHFHGLRQVKWKIYDPGLDQYQVKLSHTVRRSIYAPYLQSLLRIRRRLTPQLDPAKITDKVVHLRYAQKRNTSLQHVFRRTVTGDYLFVIYGRALPPWWVTRVAAILYPLLSLVKQSVLRQARRMRKEKGRRALSDSE